MAIDSGWKLLKERFNITRDVEVDDDEFIEELQTEHWFGVGNNINNLPQYLLSIATRHGQEAGALMLVLILRVDFREYQEDSDSFTNKEPAKALVELRCEFARQMFRLWESSSQKKS